MRVRRAVGQILGLIEAGVGIAKVFPKIARKGAALLAELPGRIRALGRNPTPAAVEVLAKELSITDALASAEDLAQGARPPFKVSRKDLREVLEFGGIRETADGNVIMRVPCPN
jgi:hypothetical protein